MASLTVSGVAARSSLSIRQTAVLLEGGETHTHIQSHKSREREREREREKEREREREAMKYGTYLAA